MTPSPCLKSLFPRAIVLRNIDVFHFRKLIPPRVPSFRPLPNADLPRLARFREQFGKPKRGADIPTQLARVGDVVGGAKAEKRLNILGWMTHCRPSHLICPV